MDKEHFSLEPLKGRWLCLSLDFGPIKPVWTPEVKEKKLLLFLALGICRSTLMHQRFPSVAPLYAA
jgi:hypothetical protein